MQNHHRWHHWRESFASFSLRNHNPAPLRNTALGNLVRSVRDRHSLRRWQNGQHRTPPPAAVKRYEIERLARQHGCTILVETGTYKGDTLYALRNAFSEFHSIELDPALHATAERRFKKWNNVHLYRGDSRSRLPGIVEKLEHRSLFWLDAHYSGGITARGSVDTPIRYELQTILEGDASRKGHVILIDDAHELGTGDYPTFEELRGLVARYQDGWEISIDQNMIAVEFRGPGSR